MGKRLSTKILILFLFVMFILPSVVNAAPKNFEFGGHEYGITQDEIESFKDMDRANEAISKKKYANKNNQARAERKAKREQEQQEKELQEDEEYIYLNENCIKKDKGFWKNEPGRGWFWGQEECVPVKRKKKVEVDLPKEEEVAEEDDEYIVSEETGEKYKKLPKRAKVPFAILDELDPDEISQRIEPETRKIVVMYPTEENILEYRKLKNWIMAKAMMLGRSDIEVRTNNPTETMPSILNSKADAVQAAVVRRNIAAGKTEIIERYANSGKMMLVVYKQDGCKYCSAYYSVLESLLKRYPSLNIEVRDIYKEGAREAINLRVETTPDTFLILEQKGQIKYQRIITGLAAMDKVEDAIVRGLSYLGEDIDELYFSY